jgi:hypothetical protein
VTKSFRLFSQEKIDAGGMPSCAADSGLIDALGRGAIFALGKGFCQATSGRTSPLSEKTYSEKHRRVFGEGSSCGAPKCAGWMEKIVRSLSAGCGGVVRWAGERRSAGRRLMKRLLVRLRLHGWAGWPMTIARRGTQRHSHPAESLLLNASESSAFAARCPCHRSLLLTINLNKAYESLFPWSRRYSLAKATRFFLCSIRWGLCMVGTLGFLS